MQEGSAAFLTYVWEVVSSSVLLYHGLLFILQSSTFFLFTPSSFLSSALWCTAPYCINRTSLGMGREEQLTGEKEHNKSTPGSKCPVYVVFSLSIKKTAMVTVGHVILRPHNILLRLIFPYPLRFAMEVITEKGHTFAEELQKVSYIILAYIGAFCTSDLGCCWLPPLPVASLCHGS